MSSRFYDIDPSLENYWRGVILFGRNVASYKFAVRLPSAPPFD